MPELNESVKPTLKRFFTNSLYVVLLLILVLVLVGVYTYRSNIFPNWFAKESEVANEVEETEGPMGDIYFTLIDANADFDTGLVPTTYIGNANDGNLTRQTFSGTQLSFSPNGEWVTFIAPVESARVPGFVWEPIDATTTQVFRAKVSDNTSLEEVVANAEQITDIEASWKSVPDINDEGEVLFVSRGVGTSNADTELSPLPSDWTVHYVDQSGSATDMGVGIYPQWYKTDGFIYLSDRGIMFHRKDEDFDTIVLTNDGFETQYFDLFFDISDDGSVLALATPIGEFIETYGIAGLNDAGSNLITLEPLAAFSGQSGAWPQISPDNKYIGAIDLNTSNFIIYKTDTLEPLQSITNMEMFDSGSLFITEWQ